MIEAYRFSNNRFVMLTEDYDCLTKHDVPDKPEAFKFELFVNKMSVRFQCTEQVQLRFVPLKRIMRYASYKDLRTNSTITIGPSAQYVLFFRTSPRDIFTLKLQSQMTEERFMQLLPLISNARVVAEGNFVQQQA